LLRLERANVTIISGLSPPSVSAMRASSSPDLIGFLGAALEPGERDPGSPVEDRGRFTLPVLASDLDDVAGRSDLYGGDAFEVLGVESDDAHGQDPFFFVTLETAIRFAV
jgi:hypothetical protein